MSRLPDVSVVIPTRNRWELLSTGALPSALAQEGVEIEVHVIDEGSSDATSQELERLNEPRVHVIRHDRPQGVAQARNAGIAAARGQWVAFLDDDDIWAPQKLRRQIDTADAEGADFVYTASAALDERRQFLYSLQIVSPDDLANQLLRRNVISAGSSNVIARTDFVRRLGGFDERLFQLADWDLWIRLALNGRAAACPEILVGCVVHRGSMLLTDPRDVFREVEYLVAKHRTASVRRGVTFDLALFPRWVAEGHLRAGRRFRAAATYFLAARRFHDGGALLRAVAALFGASAVLAVKRALGRAVPVDARDVASPPTWLASVQQASEASMGTPHPLDRPGGY
jgi:glycosyltransferase involved in cell wall biosynthesis